MVKIHLSGLLGEHKMKQAELSRRTGIRPNTISDLYHGTAAHYNPEHLDRICEALDCELSELLTRTPNQILKTGNDPIWEPHANRKSN